MLCFATPYTPETLPMKIGAFTLFSSVVGITLAPLVTIAGGYVKAGGKGGLHMGLLHFTSHTVTVVTHTLPSLISHPILKM